MLSRIPNRDTLTTCSHLVLDCTEFSSRSSYNEPRWGNPQDVEVVRDIREWTAGLRKGGGDGNVLKERAKNQNGETHVQILLPDVQNSLSRPRQPQPPLKAQPASKARCSTWRGKGKEVDHSFARKRERRWVAYSRYPERYSTIPVSEGWKEVVRGLSIYGDEESCAMNWKAAKRNTNSMVNLIHRHRTHLIVKTGSHPLDLGSSQPSQSQLYESSAREDPAEESRHGSWPSQQATPPPSGSPEPQSRGEQEPAQSSGRSASPLSAWDSSEDEEDKQVHVSGISQSNLPPSSYSPLFASPSPHRHSRSLGPTPVQSQRAESYLAQGRKLTLNAGNHQSSSLIASSPEMSKIAENGRQHSMSPLRSSPLVSHVIATQTVNYLSSPSREYGLNVRRKVSPPPQPQPLPLGEKPLVLVPNSDTSGSQGQTQNQSQEEQVKKKMEVEEAHNSQGSIASPIHIPSGGGNLSEGSIVPETQPHGSGTKIHGQDEEELTADGNEYVREVELSMEVHPGTIVDDCAGAEGENPPDQVDDKQNQQLTCFKETDLDHTGFQEDDAQTLEHLFGLRRNTIPDICYSRQDWVRPSFMEPTRGHSEISLKRKGGDLGVDDQQVDGPVGKKARVKHDAVRREPIATPTSIDREPKAKKLNGYTVGLDDMKSSEPWMMTWERLGRILLTTGRARVHDFKSRHV
ncbi:hypothetical protein E1B28_000771 [Marasmius oreades]|uniref:Uncharacterized protein n=1 Tax=Marasmius oreades TaxID=181124 RepID=A0A9P7V246_9AGAR|nr:uncharacterized protein E1B28_000771 [Marasmius oreades]KAG7098870.1 hypothetical protein E1B28_000771 [Marasmius oreades]